MEHAQVGDWMQTASGGMYWPMSPRASDITIQDIAQALSNICRFGGHVSRFYSVAEHSVNVSMCVPREHAMQALLHDATEAYIGDMVRPLKQNVPQFQEIEALSWVAVCERFGVPVDMHPSVKHADNTVLLAERDELLATPPVPWTWAAGLEPAKVDIVGYLPSRARAVFLSRFLSLGGQL